MLNLYSLEEMDGLTPALVEAWLLTVGYQPCGAFSGGRRFTRDSQDKAEAVGLCAHQIFVGQAESLQSSLLLLAEREGMTLQELLRRINPRWLARTPDAEDRTYHQEAGGLWLRRVVAGGQASAPVLLRLVDPPTEAELAADRSTNAEYWPVNRDGYRVPWRPAVRALLLNPPR